MKKIIFLLYKATLHENFQICSIYYFKEMLYNNFIKNSKLHYFAKMKYCKLNLQEINKE